MTQYSNMNFWCFLVTPAKSTTCVPTWRVCMTSLLVTSVTLAMLSRKLGRLLTSINLSAVQKWLEIMSG